jgi:hypothetical protein
LFSSFARVDSFSAVPKASTPVFKFCALELIFGGIEGVVSRFHVLRARNHFRQYRGRRLSFSCFALPDSFSTVPRASAPVFKFCVLGLIFGRTEDVGSRFYVLRVQTNFRRYQGHRVPFSSFAFPYSFSAVPRASAPVFKHCAPRLIFGRTEGVVSRFLVLRARNNFRRFRGQQVPFSCFARQDSFSAEPRESFPVFIFCAQTHFRRYRGRPVPFYVLRARTHFGRYRGRRVPFSSFARPDSFSAVRSASAPVFMFWAPGPILKFCAPGYMFGVTVGVGSRFHVKRARTHFLRYRGRRVPYSYFARLGLFSAVPRASGPTFKYCAPCLIFDGIEGVMSLFQVLRSGLVFGGTEGVGSRFHVLRARARFRRYRGRRVPFSYFVLPDSFSSIPMASAPDFKFFVPELIFGGTEGVGSHFLLLRARTHFHRYRGRCVPFHVLHSRTRFLRYRGRRVPFSYFASTDSFSVVLRGSAPVFMFCAPELIFGVTEGVKSRFQALRV